MREKANDDPNYMFRLGVCYTQGKHFPQNFEEAVNWLQKAVDEKHALAYNNLGTTVNV
jgi:TPR repeat protein